MSCLDCQEAQELHSAGIFYRWKNARIEIRGCITHIKEILKALDKAQDMDKKVQADKEFWKKRLQKLKQQHFRSKK